MIKTPDAIIDGMAQSCVDSMGDIFWDFAEHRDGHLGFSQPRQNAVNSVAATLYAFAASMESNQLCTTALRLEYREIISDVGENRDDQRIISALVDDADWTERGAREVLQLARMYGTSILRNALALAEAMDIEDGEAGL